MENIKFMDIEQFMTKELVTYVIIDRGNGEFTSMPKTLWDEQQKAAELGGKL